MNTSALPWSVLHFETPLVISIEQHRQTQQWLAAPGTPERVAQRCHIALAASQGRVDGPWVWPDITSVPFWGGGV